MKVKIHNDKTWEVIGEAFLDDVISDADSRWFVEQNLRNQGRAWVGPDADHLLYLTPVATCETFALHDELKGD